MMATWVRNGVKFMLSPDILNGARIEASPHFSQLGIDNVRDHRHHCAMNAQNSIKKLAVPAIAPADFIAGMAKGMAVLESFDTERHVGRAACWHHPRCGTAALADLGAFGLFGDGRQFLLAVQQGAAVFGQLFGVGAVAACVAAHVEPLSRTNRRVVFSRGAGCGRGGDHRKKQPS